MNKGKPTANIIALQGAIFHLQFEIVYKLQAMEYQTKRLTAYRNALVGHMVGKVREELTPLIEKILHTDYLDGAGVSEFEEIREKLRNLMKYIPTEKRRYDTSFTDEILDTQWKDSELDNDDLKNYKEKAEYYIREHQDEVAIAKLRTNQPLTESSIESLEDILWSEIGSKQDYERELGNKPLGEFVREIVGLDMNAAKEAFAGYLDNTSLDSRQIYL